MASKAGNTAKQLPDTQVAAEPSMDEILASIKQIIAEDEAPTDGKSERERYTYPDDHSNSNEADVADTLEMDMEAALQAELEGSMVPDVSVPEVKEEITIGDKAAQVRAELSAVSAGLTADERIAQYRSQGKLQIDALIAAKEEEKRARVVAQAAVAAPTPIPVAPIATGPLLPTTNAIAQEMASTMMSEKSEEIQALLADLMRPTIRQWLSDNLPTMVEKLVREEIQAASRGRKATS
ncbi:MAG: DUF2497 domain-containing protein [Rhizobiaceae bacterium]